MILDQELGYVQEQEILKPNRRVSGLLLTFHPVIGPYYSLCEVFCSVSANDTEI